MYHHEIYGNGDDDDDEKGKKCRQSWNDHFFPQLKSRKFSFNQIIEIEIKLNFRISHTHWSITTHTHTVIG